MNIEERNRWVERVWIENSTYINRMASRYLTSADWRSDKETAGDVEHLVVCKLLTGALERFRGDCSMKTYLGRITWSCVANYIRSQRRHVREFSIDPDDFNRYEYQHAFGDFEEQLLDRMEMDEVEAAMSREALSLGEEYPVMFRMIFEEDRPYREVARAIGRSVSTVAEKKGRLCRALKRVVERDFPDLAQNFRVNFEENIPDAAA